MAENKKNTENRKRKKEGKKEENRRTRGIRKSKKLVLVYPESKRRFNKLNKSAKKFRINFNLNRNIDVK